MGFSGWVVHIMCIANIFSFVPSTWYHVLNPRKPAPLFYLRLTPRVLSCASVLTDILKCLLNISTGLAQVSSQSLLRNIVQTFLHNLDDTAAVTGIRIFQILSHPSLHIGDFREGITWSLLAGVQLGEADTETELVDIGIGDDVICGGGHRRVNQ